MDSTAKFSWVFTTMTKKQDRTRLKVNNSTRTMFGRVPPMKPRPIVQNVQSIYHGKLFVSLLLIIPFTRAQLSSANFCAAG